MDVSGSAPVDAPVDASAAASVDASAAASGDASAAVSRQAASRGSAGESEEQQNYRWAMAKEFGEACDGNRTSAKTPNRSDVSNTNGIANATAPQNGVSAGAGDTTVAVHANGIRSTAPAGTLGLATGT